MGLRNDDGTTRRDYLLAAWKRDRLPETYASLMGPDYDERLDYLNDWVRELHGHSGFGATGVLPLSYATLQDWSVLNNRTLDPREIEALMALDAVLCHPEAAKPEAAEDTKASTPARAWPTKKVSDG